VDTDFERLGQPELTHRISQHGQIRVELAFEGRNVADIVHALVESPGELSPNKSPDRLEIPELQLAEGTYLTLDLRDSSLDALKELHARCRKEIAVSDSSLPFTLHALRQLVEVEILRATRTATATGDLRWELAHSWMMNNLSIHTPVPALCDYLGMSPSALHRFFRSQAGLSPGAYFRKLKWQEARRLVENEGWQVKAAAYHLGYQHPNDLSRALLAHR
jgi:AraC-like DNA-binding protein